MLAELARRNRTPIVNVEHISLADVAEIAGYSSPSTLYAAARSGRLQVYRLGSRALFTTRPWLDGYLQSLKVNMSRRCRPRATDDEGDDNVNDDAQP